MDRFNRCLLVVNPSGAGFQRSKKLRASLAEAFEHTPQITVRLTKSELANPLQLRRELRKLDQTSLLVIIGGDGSANFVISELLRLTQQGPKQTTVLPIWGGNACDLAHMCNGRRRTSVRRVLLKGQRTAVHPIEYKLSKGRLSDSGWALCYLSFGSVALTARALQRSRLVHFTAKLPLMRLVSEIGVGTVALTKAQKFHIDDERKVYDLLFINGSRIAKLYKAPIRLSRYGFLRLVLQHKHPAPIMHIAHMAKAWIWRYSATTESTMTLQDAAWMQFDGEVRRVNAKTEVRVTPSTQPVYLLMTK